MKPRGGPPKEKIILFSNLTTGKPARRANPKDAASLDTQDETYAWEARENLRKKIIGKEVYFEVADDVSNAALVNRSYGTVWLGATAEGENLTTWSIESGNAELRNTVRNQLERLEKKLEGVEDASSIDPNDAENLKNYKSLVALEDTAKQAKVGRWSDDKAGPRSINWTVTDAALFIDTYHGKEIKAIVEHVFNASMIRLYLPDQENLKSYLLLYLGILSIIEINVQFIELYLRFNQVTYITLSLTGIRAPSTRDGRAEEFFDLARFNVESRMLGKDCGVLIEGMAPSGQSKEPLFVGTLQHPNGNISELLLKEGFAKCVDWSLGMMSG